MNNAEFQLLALGDPRLAGHATSVLPAWLWSSDGTRVLWANPVGAQVFNAASSTALGTRLFGPADPHRRQIAQLAGRLLATGAVRLERLQGFGAAPGMLATCGCSRLDFPDGSHGILVAASNRAGRSMPLVERLQRLVEDIEKPVAAFASDGLLIGASQTARPLLGFHRLVEAGLDEARLDALKNGAVVAAIDKGRVVLQRVGTGADIGLIALIVPHAIEAADPEPAALPPDENVPEPAPSMAPAREQPLGHQQSTPTDQPPTELALFDAMSPENVVAAPAPVTSEPRVTLPSEPFEAVSRLEQPAPQLPVRFMWQMDPHGRFALGADVFTRLIGPRTVAGFGRPWHEIVQAFGLDPEDQVMQAVATRQTWSDIKLNWPVDGGGVLPVELSGLPIFDQTRNFAGYRGFGVCRDLEALARLAALRRDQFPGGPGAAAQSPLPELPEPIDSETSHQTDLETAVEPPQPVLTEIQPESPKNVLPFRLLGDTRPPSLTPVENSAFNELARQLSARLETEMGPDAAPAITGLDKTVVEKVAPEPGIPDATALDAHQEADDEVATLQPEWLAPPEPPARGEASRDRALLDLLPIGVLIYRLDRLLYANPAFLNQMGYQSLHALEDAGGLDALYVEPGVSNAPSTSDTGTPVTISASQPRDLETPDPHAAPSATGARLYTISWDGDSALALIFSGPRNEGAAIAAAIAPPTPIAKPLVPEPSPVGHADAEELGVILDTTAEGIVMFDAEGNINSVNRSAEAMFGYDGKELTRHNLADLFAPESRRDVFDYLASVASSGVASLLDHGRETLGRESKGGSIPLSMTMGRTRPDGPNFFAVFRDLSQARQSENELREARRLADRAANAKADVLARISHEVRTPLNAIIGFAEVMIGERFGTLGNERYSEYMKDIRASGERVLSIINDLLDLSRIETGKLDLSFTSQNLNELVESCVAVMQPQANRERIIIRTSLAHTLPPVIADARALRQITLNLIGNSIHLANAGGQVIVSTAMSDFGEVMLRVRDSGHGLNDNEVAAALEPFRTPAPSDQTSESPGVSLSLTKALVEANRAKFQIRTGARSGTLIEVVFSHALAKA